MTCANCDAPAVQVVESTGGTASGRFQEKHKCTVCGATGTISGEASNPPETWTRYGKVFE